MISLKEYRKGIIRLNKCCNKLTEVWVLINNL